MSNLKKDIEEIIDEHADAVLEARDETNTSRAVELQDEADQKATTQIFNLMESVIPEEHNVNPETAGYKTADGFSYSEGYNQAIKDIKSKLIDGSEK